MRNRNVFRFVLFIVAIHLLISFAPRSLPTVNGNQPPEITIVYPSENEVVCNQSYTISWVASDPENDGISVDILLSADGGITYQTLLAENLTSTNKWTWELVELYYPAGSGREGVWYTRVEDGTYSLKIMASDGKLFTEEVTSLEVNLSLAPKLKILSPNSINQVNSRVTLTVVPIDTDMDGVPDKSDLYPFDFDNDGLPDNVDTNDDVDYMSSPNEAKKLTIFSTMKVELKIDNGNWIDISSTFSTNKSLPYSWSYEWDTTDYPDSNHSIYVRSYDGVDYSELFSTFIYTKNTKQANSNFQIFYLLGIIGVAVGTGGVVFYRKKKK